MPSGPSAPRVSSASSVASGPSVLKVQNVPSGPSGPSAPRVPSVLSGPIAASGQAVPTTKLKLSANSLPIRPAETVCQFEQKFSSGIYSIKSVKYPYQLFKNICYLHSKLSNSHR